jgi:hypothetical protein
MYQDYFPLLNFPGKNCFPSIIIEVRQPSKSVRHIWPRRSAIWWTIREHVLRSDQWALAPNSDQWGCRPEDLTNVGSSSQTWPKDTYVPRSNQHELTQNWSKRIYVPRPDQWEIKFLDLTNNKSCSKTWTITTHAPRTDQRESMFPPRSDQWEHMLCFQACFSGGFMGQLKLTQSSIPRLSQTLEGGQVHALAYHDTMLPFQRQNMYLARP